MKNSETVPYGLYVKEAVKERSVRNESLRKEALSKIFDAINHLREKIKFDDAFVFGSVARPNSFYEDSDIDIGFINLRDEDFFYSISYLSEKLGREVDVLQLESVKKLYKKVVKEGIKWTKKN